MTQYRVQDIECVDEYYNHDSKKRARVMYDGKAYEIHCYENGTFVGIIDLPGRSRYYAENAAENYVEEYGDLSEQIQPF